MSDKRMREGEPLYLGIDIGSVSVKVVVMAEGAEVLEEHYLRSRGQPLKVLCQILEAIRERLPLEAIAGIGVTGSGGKLLTSLLPAHFSNEIIAQSKACGCLIPQVRTIIEMGGEDSKLIQLEHDASLGALTIQDFAMNTICAAGTGSFLDQQATRLSLDIEGEFGALALRSQHPPRIAGRCTVFAKSDMIHLQQIGTPLPDIVAGLCYAVSRTFKSALAKGKRLEPPIAFLGGVAANAGMVKAFREILELQEDELIVPPYYASMGAIGAALIAASCGGELEIENWKLKIENFKSSISPGPLELSETHGSPEALSPHASGHLGGALPEGEGENAISNFQFLISNFRSEHSEEARGYAERGAQVFHSLRQSGSPKIESYLGIDVGSVSTNVVAIDREGHLLARRYLKTAGQPLDAVRRGLEEIGEEVGDRLQVLGVGTTGSGRYLTADYVGADLVRNEITAQATAALHFDPLVDTIFEIGGQDSKFISLQDGLVVDFTMNKVCAAGTGSFLEEQAEKLGIDIIEEFGALALQSSRPSHLGDRCTVFMESDMVSCQNKGASLKDLVAGLGYSIVLNYLHLVVGDHRVGERIFFQGGVAANRAVVLAFEKLLGKPVTVPPHHDVTGAIGVAMLAQKAAGTGPSSFQGFDLSHRRYTVETFVCKGCENLCEINQVKFGQERHAFYGARCERYEVDPSKQSDLSMPNLLQEREDLLLASLRGVGEQRGNGAGWPGRLLKGAEGQGGQGKSNSTPLLRRTPAQPALRIGIPRALYFYEYLPFWGAFFSHLGCEVVLSEVTNQRLANLASENAIAETCFPIKVTFAHLLSLLEKDLDYIFFPSIINYPRANGSNLGRIGQTCPYIPTVPYLAQAALGSQEKKDRILSPILDYRWRRSHWEGALIEMGRELKRSSRGVRQAILKGEEAQALFYRAAQERGQEVLEQLRPGDKAIVLISRPYNGCDSGLNLGLFQKLKKMGILAIPMDFLPLDSIELPDPQYHIYWRYGQKILRAASYLKTQGKDLLYPLYLTNFGCGPDSFLMGFFKAELAGYPCLQIEVDEHNADAGLVTRCEAFLDSIEGYSSRRASLRDGEGPGCREAGVQGSRGAGDRGSKGPEEQGGKGARVQEDEEAISPPPLGLSAPPPPRASAPPSSRSSTPREIYIPHMSDASYAVAAAFRAFGIPAQVMPESDEESLELGKKYSLGKECLPFVITLGDFLKVLRRPDFEPARSSFFMPTSDGPCRFGMYYQRQQQIFGQLGYPDVPFIALNQGNSNGYFSELNKFPPGFSRLAWQGIVAFELLERLYRATRPYISEKELLDRAYREGLEVISQGIVRKKLEPSLREAIQRFSSFAVQGPRDKPIIGIVGEIYLRSHRFSNQNLLDTIEELGGEVWLSSTQEWIMYVNNWLQIDSWERRDIPGFLRAYLKKRVQLRDADRLARLLDGRMEHCHEPTTSEILRSCDPYLHRSCGTEAVLSIGRSVEFFHEGASGIVSVMPFTCMPGNVVGALLKPFKEEHENIPCLSLSYDGLEDTHIRTRLEAFMAQARQYREKRRR